MSRTTADPDDPPLVELVGELSICSERFRALRARADVSDGRNGVSHLDHPQVGDLHLLHEKLDIDDSGTMQFVIHRATPGTGSTEAPARYGVRSGRGSSGCR